MYPISEMNVNLQISEDGANYKDADHVVQRAFINVIFAERVHQIAYNKCRIDSEYYTAEQNARHILTELDNTSMTNEQKKLLGDLEDAWNNMYGISLEYSYRQGLADSPIIHKELEKFGISVVKEAIERKALQEKPLLM